MACSAFRARGSVTRSAGSTASNRSCRAPRNTDRTLLNRVFMVPAASPRSAMPFTHASTWDRLTFRSSTSAKVHDRIARLIAFDVPAARSCRCDHSAKKDAGKWTRKSCPPP